MGAERGCVFKRGCHAQAREAGAGMPFPAAPRWRCSDAVRTACPRVQLGHGTQAYSLGMAPNPPGLVNAYPRLQLHPAPARRGPPELTGPPNALRKTQVKRNFLTNATLFFAEAHNPRSSCGSGPLIMRAGRAAHPRLRDLPAGVPIPRHEPSTPDKIRPERWLPAPTF